MSVRVSLLSLITAGVTFCSFSAQAQSGGSNTLPGDLSFFEKAIYFSDLVVQGVVIDCEGQDVPVQDFMPLDPREGQTIKITEIVIAVEDVLKGEYSRDELTVVAPGAYPGRNLGLTGLSYDYSIGKDVVLCANYWSHMKGGEYVIISDVARYDRNSYGEWVNRRDSSFTVHEEWLRQVARKGDIDDLSVDADVICIGDVRNITERRMEGALMEYVMLSVNRVLKGDVLGDTLTFRLVWRGGRKLKWKAPAPKINVGEEWLVFLMSDESGHYFPFAGETGMMRIVGDSVIRANRVKSTLSKTEFQRKIEEVLAIEKG